jgi:hypothetical protein
MIRGGPKVIPPDLSRKTPTHHFLACLAAGDLELLHPAIPELLHPTTQTGSCWWRLVVSLLRDLGKSSVDGSADGSLMSQQNATQRLLCSFFLFSALYY